MADCCESINGESCNQIVTIGWLKSFTANLKNSSGGTLNTVLNGMDDSYCPKASEILTWFPRHQVYSGSWQRNTDGLEISQNAGDVVRVCDVTGFAYTFVSLTLTNPGNNSCASEGNTSCPTTCVDVGCSPPTCTGTPACTCNDLVVYTNSSSSSPHSYNGGSYNVGSYTAGGCITNVSVSCSSSKVTGVSHSGGNITATLPDLSACGASSSYASYTFTVTYSANGSSCSKTFTAYQAQNTAACPCVSQYSAGTASNSFSVYTCDATTATGPSVTGKTKCTTSSTWSDYSDFSVSWSTSCEWATITNSSSMSPTVSVSKNCTSSQRSCTLSWTATNTTGQIGSGSVSVTQVAGPCAGCCVSQYSAGTASNSFSASTCDATTLTGPSVTGKTKCTTSSTWSDYSDFSVSWSTSCEWATITNSSLMSPTVSVSRNCTSSQRSCSLSWTATNTTGQIGSGSVSVYQPAGPCAGCAPWPDTGCTGKDCSNAEFKFSSIIVCGDHPGPEKREGVEFGSYTADSCVKVERVEFVSGVTGLFTNFEVNTETKKVKCDLPDMCFAPNQTHRATYKVVYTVNGKTCEYEFEMCRTGGGGSGCAPCETTTCEKWVDYIEITPAYTATAPLGCDGTSSSIVLATIKEKNYSCLDGIGSVTSEDDFISDLTTRKMTTGGYEILGKIGKWTQECRENEPTLREFTISVTLHNGPGNKDCKKSFTIAQGCCEATQPSCDCSIWGSSDYSWENGYTIPAIGGTGLLIGRLTLLSDRAKSCYNNFDYVLESGTKSCTGGGGYNFSSQVRNGFSMQYNTATNVLEFYSNFADMSSVADIYSNSCVTSEGGHHYIATLEDFKIRINNTSAGICQNLDLSVKQEVIEPDTPCTCDSLEVASVSSNATPPTESPCNGSSSLHECSGGTVKIASYTAGCTTITSVTSTNAGITDFDWTGHTGEIWAKLPDLSACGHESAMVEYKVTVRGTANTTACSKEFSVWQNQNNDGCCNKNSFTVNKANLEWKCKQETAVTAATVTHSCGCVSAASLSYSWLEISTSSTNNVYTVNAKTVANYAGPQNDGTTGTIALYYSKKPCSSTTASDWEELDYVRVTINKCECNVEISANKTSLDCSGGTVTFTIKNKN